MTANRTVLKLRAPYLVFIGDTADAMYAKTGFGLAQWVPDKVAGQLRLPGCGVRLDTEELTLAEAAERGVKSLIIAVAPVGGALPEHWNSVVLDAIALKMDIVAGLHSKLRDNPEFVEAARRHGVNLVDVRVPPKGIPVGNGQKRSGMRILTVGTDCAVGKKYTALAVTQALREAGMKATFRATGQTGIMIAGEGIPIDAVVAHFRRRRADLAGQRTGPLGRRRRPGIVVQPGLCGRHAGAGSRHAAGRAHHVPQGRSERSPGLAGVLHSAARRMHGRLPGCRPVNERVRADHRHKHQ